MREIPDTRYQANGFERLSILTKYNVALGIQHTIHVEIISKYF